MKSDTSGKIYRFKLDHNLGYGFAEVYDFTDESEFDGRYVFVYNRIDRLPLKEYNLIEITSSGIALGPITLYSFPNVRGIGAWKYLFSTDSFLLEERPITKACRDIYIRENNWSKLKDWHKSNWDPKVGPHYVQYDQVRHLETRILNSNVGIVTKFTMKRIIDMGLNVQGYYDLGDLGNRNMFIQLINTYYNDQIVEKLLNDIPENENDVG